MRAAQLLCASILVIVLAIPGVAMFIPNAFEIPLSGWLPAATTRPVSLFRSWFSRSTQAWASAYISDHFGFRSSIVRTANEIQYRTFNEIPSIGAIKGLDNGAFVEDHLLQLDGLVRGKAVWDAKFRAEAKQLRTFQDAMGARGKAFVVVLAASKPYVYLDAVPHRFLAPAMSDDFQAPASFVEALQTSGVHVIDSAAILRQTAASGIPTHPDGGAHWNYYSGCLVAAAIFADASSQVPKIAPEMKCGKPSYGPPLGSDDDLLQLMNIWSQAGLASLTPKPDISLSHIPAAAPKILVVGDSYTGQIGQAIAQARSYSAFVYAGYFQSRVVYGTSGVAISSEGPPDSVDRIRREVSQDVDSSNIVVLELVDANLWRNLFGFPAYMIKRQN
jgi:hypothetical protein